MTDPDPDERPSFLARLAIVATIGTAILQIGMAYAITTAERRHTEVDNESRSLLYCLPAVSFFSVACLYYLLKGKPTNADAVIASRLYRVWGASVIIGAIYSAILIYTTKVGVSNQFRF